MQFLTIFGIFLIFQSARAFEVGFAESDYKVDEDAGLLEVELTVTGQRETVGGVVLEVIPMTLGDYISMKGTLPDRVDSKEDPAEADLDFNSTSYFVAIEPDMDQVTLSIQILQDEISEWKETFLLYLSNVTEQMDKENEVPVKFKQDVSIVRIKQSVADRAIISFTRKTLNLYEGNEDMDEQLFIKIDGEIEPTVPIRLILYLLNDADIQIPKHINISSNDSTLLVPIHVKDDGIAEARECGDLSLVLPRVRKYGSLYEIAYTNSRLRMCINDNDIPRVGIESSDGSMGLEMIEGETKEFCAVLMEPDECNIYMELDITLSSSSDTNTDAIIFEEKQLNIPFSILGYRHCFEVSALNNSEINPDVTIQLDIMTSIRDDDYNLVLGNEYISTEPGVLIIKDDDGVPTSPANVEIQFDGSRLQISWEASSSELQPIDSFVVVVQQVTPSRSAPSRRQVQVTSLRAGDLEEYETNDTKLELVITDNSKSYTVSVCSVNSIGRVCSEPQKVVDGRKIPPLSLTPHSLEKKRRPSPGLVLAISVIVPGMILVLFLALVAVIIMCKCCSGNGKEYYPSKHENALFGGSDFDEVKYSKRYSTHSTSSVSMEWTSAEPYSCTTFSNNNNHRLSNVSRQPLGTPV